MHLPHKFMCHVHGTLVVPTHALSKTEGQIWMMDAQYAYFLWRTIKSPGNILNKSVFELALTKGIQAKKEQLYLDGSRRIQLTFGRDLFIRSLQVCQSVLQTPTLYNRSPLIKAPF